MGLVAQDEGQQPFGGRHLGHRRARIRQSCPSGDIRSSQSTQHLNSSIVTDHGERDPEGRAGGGPHKLRVVGIHTTHEAQASGTEGLG